MSSLLIVCFQDELLRAAFCYEVSATDQGPGIRLTVHGKQRSVTIKEMSMMSLDVFAAIWSVCDCPMHCFAFCTDLLVFALWPDRLHDVDKLAMTEGMKLASAALLGGVETWCKLHDQTLGMGVAGGYFGTPGL